MTGSRAGLGRRGETLAGELLTRQGYELLERNYRCARGEIDLVARQGPVWVFVEVRTRRGRKFGIPEESLTRAKRRRLIASAESYLQEHGLDEVQWRIDAVAVEMTEGGRLLRVEVIENAVERE